MKELKIDTKLWIYDSADELPENVRSLMEKAIAIRKTAYAPYSKFRVGAAILLSNGEAILGSNQENAAYPSGLCAERVALYNAGANFPGETIEMIAISAASDITPTEKPIPPCGSCRQSIAEYESKQQKPVPIYFMGASGAVYKSDSLENLLPLTFDKNFL